MVSVPITFQFFYIVPSGYTVAMNATVYFAEIYSDFPLNTPVFSIRVIVSSIDDLLDLFISLSQTGHINNLFEFEGGSNNRIGITTADLVSNGDHYVFDVSINLVEDPATEFEESDYPVELDIDLSLVGLYFPDMAIQELSVAVGSIMNTPSELVGTAA